VTVVVGAVLLAGCSSGSSSTSSALASAAPATGGVGVDAPATAPETAKDGTTAGGGQLLGAPLATSATRSVVVTANLAVQVADVATGTRDLGSVATAHAATIASQSTSAGGGAQPVYPTGSDGSGTCPSTGCPTSYASSTTTLRVDNDKADALIADLAKLGTVLSSTRTSDDITAQVADVDARVRNAQASLGRVRSLMAKATSVGDVVTLEGELSRREADLEALQARQRTFADQSAQATVTVQLLSADAPTTVDHGTGFVAGLQTGWDAFTSAMVGALTVLGALLPFLLVLVPVGLLVRWWVRRRTPKGPTTVPAGMTD
jgi:hypothetical protein